MRCFFLELCVLCLVWKQAPPGCGSLERFVLEDGWHEGRGVYMAQGVLRWGPLRHGGSGEAFPHKKNQEESRLEREAVYVFVVGVPATGV